MDHQSFVQGIFAYPGFLRNGQWISYVGCTTFVMGKSKDLGTRCITTLRETEFKMWVSKVRIKNTSFDQMIYLYYETN